MNRAQRRAQTRQNKQQPHVMVSQKQVMIRQLNRYIKTLMWQGVKIYDWDDPERQLWGFNLKNGEIHFLASANVDKVDNFEEKINDGERVSEPDQETQSAD